MTLAAMKQNVLELDKSWSPCKCISVPEAFKKVMKGVAEFVDMHENAYAQHDFDSWMDLSEYREAFEQDKHTWIQGVSQKILAPFVIRVKTYDHAKRGIVKFSRHNVYNRDNYTCQYCGKTRKSENLNLDHVVPRRQGGESTWTNIVCSCFSCNTKKGGRTPKQAKMKLIRKPVKPIWTVDLELPRVRPKSWSAFVSDAYWNTSMENDNEE